MALFAEGVLKAHWDQTVPVNLAHLAKCMGVVVRLPTNWNGPALLQMRAGLPPCIHIPPAHSRQHQRLAVAHALGHVALHHLRAGMERAIDITAQGRTDPHQRLTIEANDFALRLLLPEAALRYALSAQAVPSMEELAHVFDVPLLWVKQRMADLNLRIAPRLAQQLAPELAWD